MLQVLRFKEENVFFVDDDVEYIEILAQSDKRDKMPYIKVFMKNTDFGFELSHKQRLEWFADHTNKIDPKYLNNTDKTYEYDKVCPRDFGMDVYNGNFFIYGDYYNDSNKTSFSFVPDKNNFLRLVNDLDPDANFFVMSYKTIHSITYDSSNKILQINSTHKSVHIKCYVAPKMVFENGAFYLQTNVRVSKEHQDTILIPIKGIVYSEK